MEYYSQTQLDCARVDTSGLSSDAIEKANELIKQVSPFYPCEIAYCIALNNEEKKYCERVEVQLISSEGNFFISYSDYGKKFTIYSNDYRNFKHVNTGAERGFSKEVQQPQNIGKLTTKKIESWINYHIQIIERVHQLNEKNKNLQEDFLKCLELLPVSWYREKQGGITKNGIYFEFELMHGYISTKIEVIHEYRYGSLNTFLKLAANKISTVTP